MMEITTDEAEKFQSPKWAKQNSTCLISTTPLHLFNFNSTPQEGPALTELYTVHWANSIDGIAFRLHRGGCSTTSTMAAFQENAGIGLLRAYHAVARSGFLFLEAALCTLGGRDRTVASQDIPGLGFVELWRCLK